jgi:ABC-type branched-subunit amino acid transport system substrate-binding protein
MVFNLRASYQSEIDKIINHLVRDARHRIAIFHVTDAYGIDGLRSAKITLARHNLKPVLVSSLPRNSIDTYQVAQKIVKAKANAVLSINTFATSASLSRNLTSMGSRAQLMNLSPVGIEGLQDALPGGRADGIGISQVFPFPWNRRVPVIAQYQEMMQRQKDNAHYGYTSLEGFLAARWLTAALDKAGPNPSREKLAEAFRKLGNLDLGGFKLHLKPGSNQASQLVELTFLKSQRWGP